MSSCSIIPNIETAKGATVSSSLFADILSDTKQNKNLTKAIYAGTKQPAFDKLANKLGIKQDSETNEYSYSDILSNQEAKEWLDNFAGVRSKVNAKIEQSVKNLSNYENAALLTSTLKSLNSADTWDILASVLKGALQGEFVIQTKKNAKIVLDSTLRPFTGTSIVDIKTDINKIKSGNQNNFIDQLLALGNGDIDLAVIKLNNLSQTISFYKSIVGIKNIPDVDMSTLTASRYKKKDGVLVKDANGDPTIIEENLYDMLNELEKELPKILYDINNLYSALTVYRLKEQISGNEALENKYEEEGVNIVKGSIGAVKQDINFLGASSSGFISLGQSNSVYNQVANLDLADAEYNAQQAILEKEQLVKSAYKEFTKAGYNIDDLLDDNGTLIGEHDINVFRDTFYKYINDSNLSGKGKLDGILKEGKIIIPTELYNKYSNVQAIRDNFISGDSDVDYQYERFKEDLEVITLTAGSAQDAQNQLEHYNESKNPERMLINFINYSTDPNNQGKAAESTGRFIAKNTFYGGTIGFKPNSSNIDPRWIKIQNDPIMKNMLDALTFTSAEAYRIGPVPYRYTDSNYVFECGLQLTEQFAKSGAFPTIYDNVKDAFKKVYSKNNNAEYFEMVDPITGEVRYKLFFPSQSGEVGFQTADKAGKSRDVINAVLTHYALAKMHNEYAKIEPTLQGIYEAQRNKANLGANNKITRVEGEKASDIHLRRTVEHRLYNRTKTDEESKKWEASLTEDEKRKGELIDIEIANIEDRLRRGELSLPEANYLIAKLNESKEGIQRYVSIVQIIDSINEYFRKRGLAFNLRGALTDLITNQLILLNEAAGNQYIDFSSYWWAMKYVLTKGFKDNELNKIRKDLNIEGAVLDAKNQSSSRFASKTLDKINTTEASYFLQAQSGKFSALISMMAYLKKNGYMENYDSLTKEDKAKISHQINAFTYETLGNPDPTKPLIFKDKWIGRLLMTFKSFLPNAMKNNFGEETVDLATGTIRRGKLLQTPKRILEVYLGERAAGNDRAFLDTWSSIWDRDVMLSAGNEAKRLDETDAANVRKLAFQSILILMLTTAVMSIRGDDDDDKSEFEMLAINQINRLNQDLYYFVDPELATKLGNNPAPALTFFKDVKDLSKLIYVKATDEERKDIIQSGYRKGESKTFNKLIQMTPYASGIQSSLNASKRIIEQK